MVFDWFYVHKCVFHSLGPISGLLNIFANTLYYSKRFRPASHCERIRNSPILEKFREITFHHNLYWKSIFHVIFFAKNPLHNDNLDRPTEKCQAQFDFTIETILVVWSFYMHPVENWQFFCEQDFKWIQFQIIFVKKIVRVKSTHWGKVL